MKFEEISFSEVCPTISWSFHSSGGKHRRPEILRIMFHGSYRSGEAGNADASLISVITDCAVKFWSPKFVIIDLSDLEYRSGDDFEKIYDSVDDDDILTVVLVGPECRIAMSELYFGPDSGRDIVDNNFFFDDIDKAVKKLREH